MSSIRQRIKRRSGNTSAAESIPAGFTLAEMVMAVTIMALSLSIFVKTLSMASKATVTGRDEIVVMNYARQESEQLRTLTYDDPDLTIGIHAISNSLYSGQRTVNYWDSQTNRIKSVVTRIAWRKAVGNTTTSLTISTFISQAMH